VDVAVGVAELRSVWAVSKQWDKYSADERCLQAGKRCAEGMWRERGTADASWGVERVRGTSCHWV